MNSRQSFDLNRTLIRERQSKALKDVAEIKRKAKLAEAATKNNENFMKFKQGIAGTVASDAQDMKVHLNQFFGGF